MKFFFTRINIRKSIFFYKSETQKRLLKLCKSNYNQHYEIAGLYSIRKTIIIIIHYWTSFVWDRLTIKWLLIFLIDHFKIISDHSKVISDYSKVISDYSKITKL